MTPRVVTLEELDEVRNGDPWVAAPGGDTEIPDAVVIWKAEFYHPQESWERIGTTAADILNGVSLLPDHGRAMELLQRAMDALDKANWQDSITEDIRAFLTPPTTDIPAPRAQQELQNESQDHCSAQG